MTACILKILPKWQFDNSCAGVYASMTPSSKRSSASWGENMMSNTPVVDELQSSASTSTSSCRKQLNVDQKGAFYHSCHKL